MWKFKMIYLFIYIYEHKRSETEFHGIKVYADVEAPEARCLRSDEIRLSTCLKVCHFDSHSCITVHGIFAEAAADAISTVIFSKELQYVSDWVRRSGCWVQLL